MALPECLSSHQILDTFAMGYLRTLHLFDDQKFYNEVVPLLRGERGDLLFEYREFLKLNLLVGIANMNEAEINRIAQNDVNQITCLSGKLTANFKSHSEHPRHEDLELFLDNLTIRDVFTNFFEYYIFKSCADFFPHVFLGKFGVRYSLNLSRKSLADSVTRELDSTNILLNNSMGIINWLTHEDVRLLYLDKENIQVKDKEKGGNIMGFIEIAKENNLGLVQGLDLNDRLLVRLPAHKLISAEQWESMDRDGLLIAF